MSLMDDQERLKACLVETVTQMCKNGLHFQSEVSIDAVIGITVDKSNVFLVSIRERIPSDEKQPVPSLGGPPFSETETNISSGHTMSSTHDTLYAGKELQRALSDTGSRVDSRVYSCSGPVTVTDSSFCNISSVESLSLSTCVPYMSNDVNPVYHQVDNHQDRNMETSGTDDIVQLLPLTRSVSRNQSRQQVNMETFENESSCHSLDKSGTQLSAGNTSVASELELLASSGIPVRKTSSIVRTANIRNQMECRNALQQASRNYIKSCRDCDVPIVTESELERGGLHFAHTIRKCFPCPYCSKLFTNLFNLRGHLSQHTGVKEFSCPVCCSEHSFKHNLIKHMVIVHGTRVDRPPCRRPRDRTKS